MGQNVKVAVIGGGASGVFAAICAAESSSQAQVDIFEKSQSPLAKVRISGGGRCNVTHACFDPRELIDHYPRGSQELLGPFHKF
jgi:predicted flavoprotein YhiN